MTPSMIASYLLHFMVISFITLPASQLRTARHAPTVRRDGDGRPGGYDRNSTSHMASGLWGMVRLRDLANPTVGNTWLFIPNFLKVRPWGNFCWLALWIFMNIYIYNIYVWSFQPSKSRKYFATGRSKTDCLLTEETPIGWKGNSTWTRRIH